MVITFSGRLTEGDRSEAQYAELRRFVEEGERQIVFDLEGVRDIDSRGLGFLVMCLTTVERAGGQLRLAAPCAKVRSVLLMTKLNSIFSIFPSVQSAQAV